MIIKRNFRLILISGIILYGAFLLTGCAGLFAKSLVYANRQAIIKNPGHYGMKYQDISIPTSDGLNLSGWFIPAKGNELVIITHPMNFTKYGYSVENQGRFKITDIEVEFLNTAKQLNESGYNVLTFDLRNHGESDSSPDGIFGLGVLEWKDITGTLDYIAGDSKLNYMNIHFLSFCTGANATIIAMNKSPDHFKRVKSLVAVQPISTQIFTEKIILDLYPILKGMIPDMEEAIINEGGLSYQELTPEQYMSGILTPVLFVQAENDYWTELDFVKDLVEKSPEPKELLLLHGDMHRFDINFFQKYK